MLSEDLWPPMLRLLRRATAAIILIGGWQAIVDMVMT
jgi:hypothetical protein